jgi:hypothetical protein
MCIGTKVAIKVFLEGAYNSTTGNVMNTTLKTNNLLPLTEPYTGLSSTMSKFTHIGGGSEAATTLNSNIVDWVFVELYTAPVSPSTTPTLVATKSVLLRADGQVVDAADQSKVYVDFSSRTGGDYIVGVRHRNHLAVITDNVITLTCDALSPVAVDFTTTVNPVSTSKMNVDNNVTLMRAGELNGNDSISALDVLKARQANTSGQTDGYKLEDVNMSGQATATDVLMTRKNNKSN